MKKAQHLQHYGKKATIGLECYRPVERTCRTFPNDTLGVQPVCRESVAADAAAAPFGWGLSIAWPIAKTGWPFSGVSRARPRVGSGCFGRIFSIARSRGPCVDGQEGTDGAWGYAGSAHQDAGAAALHYIHIDVACLMTKGKGIRRGRRRGADDVTQQVRRGAKIKARTWNL